MTDPMPNSLCRALLIRASLPEPACPDVERERIIRFFRGDSEHIQQQLIEAKQARDRREYIQAERIIARIIQQHQEAKP